MEKFLAINWHPSIEDWVDDVFIRDERLETESVAYRSLIGKWQSPFGHVEEDYHLVDINKVKIIKAPKKAGKKPANEASETDSDS